RRARGWWVGAAPNVPLATTAAQLGTRTGVVVVITRGGLNRPKGLAVAAADEAERILTALALDVIAARRAGGQVAGLVRRRWGVGALVWVPRGTATGRTRAPAAARATALRAAALGAAALGAATLSAATLGAAAFGAGPAGALFAERAPATGDSERRCRHDEGRPKTFELDACCLSHALNH